MTRAGTIEDDLPPPGLRGLLGLAWPIIVSRSTQVVVGLADALMIAHLGEAAVAAVTTGALNAVAAFILPMGIAVIISSFSAQMTGRGDREGARRFGWYGLGLAAVTQALVLAGLPALPWLLGQLDYAAGVEAGMRDYLSIRFLSTGAEPGLTGACRPSRMSAQQWEALMRNKAGTEERYRRLLAEQARSGLSVRAFARTSGVPAGTLSSWKHELRKRAAARATKRKAAGSFVPVEVIDQAEAPSGGAGYEVVLGRALVLRLPRDFDVPRVAALVKAVASC